MREGKVEKGAGGGVGEGLVARWGDGPGVGCPRSANAFLRYPPRPPICLARLNSVAHGAETWKRFRPFVARRASDNTQRVRSSEFQPFHHGDGGIVLAAGRIDAPLTPPQPVHAALLPHPHPPNPPPTQS